MTNGTRELDDFSFGLSLGLRVCGLGFRPREGLQGFYNGNSGIGDLMCLGFRVWVFVGGLLG